MEWGERPIMKASIIHHFHLFPGVSADASVSASERVRQQRRKDIERTEESQSVRGVGDVFGGWGGGEGEWN
jgi:hypothetical protein